MKKFAGAALTGLIGLSVLVPVADAQTWFGIPGKTVRDRIEAQARSDRYDNDRYDRYRYNGYSRHDNGRHLGWYKNRNVRNRSAIRTYEDIYSSSIRADIDNRLSAIRRAKPGKERQRLQAEFYQVYPNWGKEY